MFTGYQSGNNNSIGQDNVAIGNLSMSGNVDASRNVAIGSKALYTQSYAGGFAWNSENVAIGYEAMYFNQPTATTNGRWNTAIGTSAMKANTSGSYSTGIGHSALTSNNTGTKNTAVGYLAMELNTTGFNNSAVGVEALWLNTIGQQNTALGMDALMKNDDGNSNTGIGYGALQWNITGDGNTAVGGSAATNATGSGNTVMGQYAFNQAKAGSQATAIGYQAMFYANNTTVPYNSTNVAVGYQSLHGSTNAANNTGNGNTAIGHTALKNYTLGSNNTALGYLAGETNTTGSNNTFLGYNADATTNNLTNATAIGANAVVGASNSMVLGGTGGNAVNVGIGTSTPAYKLDVTGSANILSGSADPLVVRSTQDGFSLTVKESDNGNDAVNIFGYASRGRMTMKSNGITNINFDANSSLASYINAGNVGIGTTDPAYKLDVNGESRVGYMGSPDTIPLVPSDFIIVFGESAMHQFGENWGIGPIAGGGSKHFMAQIPIPVGYKAKKVVIKTYRDDNNYGGNPHNCLIWSMRNQISRTASVPLVTASVTGDGVSIATFADIVAYGNSYVGIEVKDIPELPGNSVDPPQEMITGGYLLIQRIVP